MMGVLAEEMSTMQHIESWALVIVTILMPLIILQLESARRRLSKGDEKFEALSTTITRIDTKTDNHGSMINEIRGEVKAIGKDGTKFEIEMAEAIGDFKTEIERDFAKKADLGRVEKHLSEQIERLACKRGGCPEGHS